MLANLGLDVTRYVDDYRIIARPDLNTHTILCRLAEHLMVTEGLSLNVAKTRIVDTVSLRASAQAKLEDVFSQAEMIKLRGLLSITYGDEDADDDEDEHTREGDEDDDPQPANPFLTGDDLLNRLDELERHEEANFSSRKAILKVLRQFPDFEVLRFVRTHKRLAYHLPRDFCRALRAACKAGNADRHALGEEIWALILTPPVSELPYARMWLLNLFANGTLKPDWRTVNALPYRLTPLEERQQIFIRALLGDRAFFRAHRGQLGQVGEWTKPALLMGAACLPADEYTTWIDIAVRQLADPFAAAFGIWLKRRTPLEQLLTT